jgi:hypothetical protein
MRSLKKESNIGLGCNLTPGKIYILESINRCEFKEYIFEFDSIVSGYDGSITINQRNKWVCDGVVHVCNGNWEGLISLPCGEEIKLRRYRKTINWDEI